MVIFVYLKEFSPEVSSEKKKEKEAIIAIEFPVMEQMMFGDRTQAEGIAFQSTTAESSFVKYKCKSRRAGEHARESL